jgi:hypothetical protein
MRQEPKKLLLYFLYIFLIFIDKITLFIYYQNQELFFVRKYKVISMKYKKKLFSLCFILFITSPALHNMQKDVQEKIDPAILWSAGKYQKTLIKCDQNLFKDFDKEINFQMLQQSNFTIKPTWICFDAKDDQLFHVLYGLKIPLYKREDLRERTTLNLGCLVVKWYQETLAIDTTTKSIVESLSIKRHESMSEFLEKYVYDKAITFISKERIEQTPGPFFEFQYQHTSCFAFLNAYVLEGIAYNKNESLLVLCCRPEQPTFKRSGHKVFITGEHNIFDLEIHSDALITYACFNPKATLLALALEDGTVILVSPCKRTPPGNYLHDLYFSFK